MSRGGLGTYAALLAVVLTALPSPARASRPQVLTIEAEVVEVDLAREHTQARGRARLSHGELEVTADEVAADRRTGEVQARGRLTVVQGERRLEGESLEYDLGEERGVLRGARVREQGLVVRGERVEISPTEVVAEEASFTTCDLEEPHYQFAARRISLTAQRLRLEGARIIYRDRTLLRLPSYSARVGELEEPGATPLPVSGFSRDDGPYASVSYRLKEPADRLWADVLYRYTTRRGIRGHAMALGRAGPAEVSFGYVRREDATDRRELRADELEGSLDNVLVDRAPEYGVRVRGYPLRPGLALTAEVLGGRYSEREPGEELARAQGGRWGGGLLLAGAPYEVARGVKLSHAAGWRGWRYEGGGRHGAWLLRHGVELEVGGGRRVSLAYVTRRDSGETPFLFDDVGASRELLGDVEWRLGPVWRMRLVESYDLEARRTRDMIVSVTRTVHCLDYTAGWRQARGTVFVGVGLAVAGGDEGGR